MKEENNQEKIILFKWLLVQLKSIDRKELADFVNCIDLKEVYEVEIFRNFKNFCNEALLQEMTEIDLSEQNTNEYVNSSKSLNQVKYERCKLIYRYSADELFFFEYKKEDGVKKMVPNFRPQFDTIILLEREVILADKDTDDIILAEKFYCAYIYSKDAEEEVYINYEIVQEAELMSALNRALPNFEYELYDEFYRIFKCSPGDGGYFYLEFHKNFETHLGGEDKAYLDKYLEVIEDALGDKFTYEKYNKEDGLYYYHWYVLDEETQEFMEKCPEDCIKHLEESWKSERR